MKAPKDRQDVILEPAALARLLGLRQRRRWTKEAGGQLFGEVKGQTWRVIEATGLRKGDLRSLMSFRPNRTEEQREIDEAYSRGLHFLGDWHTHREQNPVPSQTDISSMQDMASQSLRDLPCFLLIIVGLSEDPADWHMSKHDRNDWLKL